MDDVRWTYVGGPAASEMRGHKGGRREILGDRRACPARASARRGGQERTRKERPRGVSCRPCTRSVVLVICITDIERTAADIRAQHWHMGRTSVCVRRAWSLAGKRSAPAVGEEGPEGH